jgi:deoxyribonuclease (pyrimidine dimer)
MTRVNVGVRPSELSRQHLLAEAREIKRVPNIVKSGRYSMAGQPKEFTLGTGHVKFFYDKLLYLKKRYVALYNEGRGRGYDMTDFSSAWDGVPSEMLGDYSPTKRDREITLERIKERTK